MQGHYLRISPRLTVSIFSHLHCTASRSSNHERQTLKQRDQARRCLHTSNTRGLQGLCCLQSRGVVRLAGKDTVDFLQGLVTSDIHQLAEKSPNIQYSMMLNVQGRVLYDLFLYNISKTAEEPTTFLVDADKTVITELIKILKKYKIRKKVDISDVSDELHVWTSFGQKEGSPDKSSVPDTDKTYTFHDPRVPLFASRIISDQDQTASGTEQVSEADYRIHRYQWGVPEGVSDLPPGNCLPLESNLSFMNGVNFQKGCYIGQELTARTFHTGVIRKRLLPLVFDSPVSIEADSTISTEEKGQNAGKFRSSEGRFGLGLVRLARVEEKLVVPTRDGETVSVKTEIPKWWPNTSL